MYSQSTTVTSCSLLHHEKELKKRLHYFLFSLRESAVKSSLAVQWKCEEIEFSMGLKFKKGVFERKKK